jgi:hypothetical protein
LNQRQAYLEILQDQRRIPTEDLFRPADPWFGINTRMNFLFAPGVTKTSLADYEAKILTNHYNKSVNLGELRVAKNLNQNLGTYYEVVYLEIRDPLYNYDDPVLGRNVPKNTIDLRPYITNYYVKDGQSYYLLNPNGLQNMMTVIADSIGFTNIGLVPTWMTSLQPDAKTPGVFFRPTGLEMVMVLAYVKPGAGDRIRYNLRDIQWNQFDFVFDRYQLENNLTEKYNTETNSYIQGDQSTFFDNGFTIFDSNSMKLVENMDYYVDPGFNHKYVKFPKSGVFR